MRTSPEQSAAQAPVVVLLDFKIYAYLFVPIVTELVRRGMPVHLYCPAAIREFVRERFGSSEGITFHDLDVIKRAHRTRWRLHRVLRILCTRADFSFQYNKRRRQLTKKAGGVQGVLMRLARITPKVPNRRINAFLHSVCGWGLTNPFVARDILVGSLNASPELLCAKDQRVFTVMESWDHPVKEPNGYSSYRVYAWNSSLGEDWQRAQGDREWREFFPLKLRYALTEIGDKQRWQRHRGRPRPLCVYAVASTRAFSIEFICRIERRIIADLIEATRRNGWDLYVKPRPNGVVGEFDEFAAHDHVTVGPILDEVIDVPANYYLDDSYNEQRFREILDAEFVINAFTTFGLDAAAAGIPVLQLDLRAATGYEDSSMIYDNHHIKNYLLNSPDTLRVEGVTLQDAMRQHFADPGDRAERYRDSLRLWLFGSRSLDTAVREMIDDVVACASSVGAVSR